MNSDLKSRPSRCLAWSVVSVSFEYLMCNIYRGLLAKNGIYVFQLLAVEVNRKCLKGKCAMIDENAH